MNLAPWCSKIAPRTFRRFILIKGIFIYLPCTEINMQEYWMHYINCKKWIGFFSEKLKNKKKNTYSDRTSIVTLIFGIVWFSLHRDIYEVKVIDIWPLYCITLSKLHWLRTPDHHICKNRAFSPVLNHAGLRKQEF